MDTYISRDNIPYLWGKIKAIIPTMIQREMNFTVSPSDWSDTAPYTYTYNNTDILADMGCYIGLSDSATAAEAEAATNAKLRKTGQTDGSITITAEGDKPTTAISLHISGVLIKGAGT